LRQPADCWRLALPQEKAGTWPEGCPAPRLMMRLSHSEKKRLTKWDSSVFVDACTKGKPQWV